MEILFFVISLCATTIGAISGIGGGVIIKPVLDATNTMSASSVSFLSGCTVLSMSVVSLWNSRKGEVRVDKRRSTYLALGSALGGFLGKKMVDVVKLLFEKEDRLGLIQAIVLLVITVGVYIYIKKQEQIKPHEVNNPFVCTVIGIILGLLSSFLGIGGGPMNIAVLYYFFSMDSKTAAKNSIYIILFSQITSLASTIASCSVPKFNQLLLVLMIIGGILGGILGSSISKKISGKTVEHILVIVLFIIIGVNVFNIVSFLWL